MWLMNRFVKVRNRVAKRPVLPGTDDVGIMKLICETPTIAAQGR